MKALQSPRTQRMLGFALLALLACWLYVPYLDNPLVFDDANIFYTGRLTRAAIAPWDEVIRGLPYFTLGWVQTQIGSMAAHRWVSLALHLLVGWQLFRFLEELLTAGDAAHGQTAGAQTPARWVALLVATAFVCHPVAVYGAAYLVQRTIVFATLFSLLGLRCLLAALQRNSLGQAASAAVWVSLAILSKEHAVGVPTGALALMLVAGNSWRDRLKIAGVFWALSIPAMVLAVYTALNSVGTAYEPGLGEIKSELYALPAFSGSYEQWLLSASTQAQLYFQYWLQWMWPNPARMSVDLRVDFLRAWTHAGAWAWIAGFIALPLFAVALSLRWPRWRIAAFALVFTALVCSVELTSIRFQEPYVLYRSYLWSVGYFTLLAVLISCLPAKPGLGLLALAIPLLLFQARDRLDTFHTKLALWEDAGAKLPKPEIAGASRIFFNRGGERFRAGKIASAMDDINEAIRLNPSNGQYRIARASAKLRLGRAADALEDLKSAKQFLPEDGHLEFVEFQALRALGRTEEADAALRASARHGYYGARFEIARRNSTNGDVAVEMPRNPDPVK